MNESRDGIAALWTDVFSLCQAVLGFDVHWLHLYHGHSDGPYSDTCPSGCPDWLHGGLHPLSPLRPVFGELVNFFFSLSLSLNSCSEKTTSHVSPILLTYPLFCSQYLSLCVRQYLEVGGSGETYFCMMRFFSITPPMIPGGLWTTWSPPLLSDNVGFPYERVGEEALPGGAAGLPPHCPLGEPGIRSSVQTPSLGFGMDLLSPQPLCFHCWNGPGESPWN